MKKIIYPFKCAYCGEQTSLEFTLNGGDSIMQRKCPLCNQLIEFKYHSTEEEIVSFSMHVIER